MMLELNKADKNSQRPETYDAMRILRRMSARRKTEGCMKHEPNGREKSETARDWDPRTHDRKSNANSRQTKVQMSTRNAWKKQESVQQMEAAVDRTYGAKHHKIVTSNKGELPGASQNLNKVEYLESWGSAFDMEVSLKNANPSRT